MASISRVESILLFVAVAIIAVNSYLASIPEIPRYVVIGLGVASVVAVIAREQLKPQIEPQPKPVA